jgi:hypothetical protein
METPKYLQVLWNYKWLLIFGAVVAAIAAFFSGFAIVNGGIVSRAQQTWSASTTMLLTSESAHLFEAELPGVPVQQGVTEPQFTNLSENALVYAYIISSDAIKKDVEAAVGTLDPDTESITSMRRTTQPSGDERFPGRYELPVLEAVGTAATSDRAEEISRATAAAFVAYLTAQQDGQDLDPALRVLVDPLADNPAVEGDSSNPAIPVVVTFLGVFLAFVVLAFVIAGIRSGAAKRKEAKAAASPSEDAAPEHLADEAESSTEPGYDDVGADDTDQRELVSTGTVPTRRSADND